MPFLEHYQSQVRLILQLVPIIAREQCFALKGGTAINLFIRELPRLSVDIDLTYLPVHRREEALTAIDAAFRRIESAALSLISGAKSTQHLVEGSTLRLVIRANRAQVKIECSPVVRGVVNKPVLMQVSDAVEAGFGFAEMSVASFDDLYAGKLVAALDRQHPRDLFDVALLLEKEGISETLRHTFLLYLLSHNRPMGEVLSGRVKDLAREYQFGFDGMTDVAVPMSALIATQANMIDLLITRMPKGHRAFLISFEEGHPEWELIGLSEAPTLPAIQWRTHNLDGLTPAKRKALVAVLRSSLSREPLSG